MHTPLFIALILSTAQQPTLQGELARLEPILGTWEVNAEWRGGMAVWSRATYTVGVGGNCIEGRVRVRDGDGEPYDRYLSVYTYDTERSQFVAHTFQNNGSYKAQDIHLEGDVLITEWTEGGVQLRDESTFKPDGGMNWKVRVKPSGAADYQTVMDADWVKQGDPPQRIDSGRIAAGGQDVRSFVRKETIAADVADVYAAWTDGPTFARSYDPTRAELAANIDLAIGGRYEWLWDGKTGSNGCQVLSYIPNRMVSFTWNAPPSQPESRAKHTWVVVEFAPVNAGTEVTLTHLGFGPEKHWDETFAYFGEAWKHVLGQFKRQLESRAG